MNEQTRIMSILAVMVMVSCCVLVPVFVEDSDAAYNEIYSVDLCVGYTFDYTPTVNMEGATIEASGSAMTANGGFLTYSGVGTSLSGTATAAGSYTAVLTATYVGEVTQTATQTINFTVYDAISFTGSTSAYGIIGQSFTYSLTIDGPSDLVVSTVFSDTECGLTASYNSGTLTISGDTLAGAMGTPITATVTASSATSGGSDDFAVTINPYDDLAITSDGTIYTYVGASCTYTITTNYNSDEDATITLSADTSTITSGVGTATLSDDTITFSFLEDAVTGTYTDYTISVGASGTYSSGSLTFSNASQTVNVRVYAALSFTTTPTASNVTAVGSTGNSAQVAISTVVEGATTITYYWGDDTATQITPTVTTSATYIANHSYTTTGVYEVEIVAENDSGSTTSIILYNAGTGTMIVGDESTDSGDSFIDGIIGGIMSFFGGILAFFTGHVIFTVILAALIITAIVGIVWKPAWIGTAISLILMGISYLLGWLGF